MGKTKTKTAPGGATFTSSQQGQIDQLIEGLARWSHKQWVQLQANSLEPRWARDLGPSPYFPKALGAAGAAGDPPGSPL